METNNFKQNFINTLGFKILLVFFIGLLLLIPMALVRGVIYDRQSYQHEAINSIIQPIGGEFSLNGVMIAIPYYYYESVNRVSGNTTVLDNVRKNDYILIMPSAYSVEAHMESDMLRRGIFKTPVFYSDMNITATFSSYELDSKVHFETVSWDDAVLIVATGDRKNSVQLPDVVVKGKSLELYETASFSSVDILSNAFVYSIDDQFVRDGFTSDVTMGIQGGSAMHLLPMAGNNTVSLSSDWEDVGFTGNWLPVERNFSDDGFSAKWEIAGFNTPLYGIRYLEEIDNYYNDDYYYEEKTKVINDTINANFLLSNNNYTKTERSVKYAMLFIFIPFFALFLCELLTKKKIHAVQYGLIGITNIIFYMLLLSISEHLGFNISYIISSIAVIAATGLYVWGITKTIKLGIIIAIVEVVVYAFLFGILQLTDFALLFGTIGLFFAVVVAMYFTRNIEINQK